MVYRIASKCLSMGAIPAEKDIIKKTIPYIRSLVAYLEEKGVEEVEDVIVLAFTYYRLTGDKDIKTFIDEVCCTGGNK